MYGSWGYLLGVLLDRLLETCGQASWQRSVFRGGFLEIAAS